MRCSSLTFYAKKDSDCLKQEDLAVNETFFLDIDQKKNDLCAFSEEIHKLAALAVSHMNCTVDKTKNTKFRENPLRNDSVTPMFRFFALLKNLSNCR